MLKSLGLFVFICIMACQPMQLPKEKHIAAISNINDLSAKINLTAAERTSRKAAVKIISLQRGGHGTGTLFQIKNKLIIITAKHVTNGEPLMQIVAPGAEMSIAKLIYEDPKSDFAALVLLGTLPSREPAMFMIKELDPEFLVGAKVFYTGYPGVHQNLTSRGYIASYEQGHLLINGYAWFGASGSGVFDNYGRLVGVLSGIDSFQGILVEDIVWVVPIKSMNRTLFLEAIKNA